MLLRSIAGSVADACRKSSVGHADITYVSNDSGEWWEVSYETDGGATTVTHDIGRPGDE